LGNITCPLFGAAGTDLVDDPHRIGAVLGRPQLGVEIADMVDIALNDFSMIL